LDSAVFNASLIFCKPSSSCLLDCFSFTILFITDINFSSEVVLDLSRM